MPNRVHRSSFIVHRKKQAAAAANNEQRTTNHIGFTLIELMVSISIIAILATVGMVIYTSAQKSARVSKRSQDLTTLKTAIEIYKNATGSYPIQNGWACISTPLAPLAPSYMPSLPADPLDSGDAGGTNCYQYTSGGMTSEYKLRTNPNLTGGDSPEMTSALFAQQTALVDPAKDSGSDPCIIELQAGVISGWALYSGSTACGFDNIVNPGDFGPPDQPGDE